MKNESQQWYLNFCKDKKINPKDANSLTQYEQFLKPLKQVRDEVLKTIKPICKVFGICDYDYIVGYAHEFLRIGNVKINCTFNSSDAILNELIGYLFVKYYASMNYTGNSDEVIEIIKSKWQVQDD